MISWDCKAFDQLDGDEVFDILKLRQDVFIVEQSCVYNDIDDLDKLSIHLCGYDISNHVSRELRVYARVIAPGVKFKEAAVGRVVVNPNFRASGLGLVLMEKALSVCKENFLGSAVRISGQAHLEKFYHSLGFSTVSEPYDEDGIPHIEMLKQA